MEAAQADYEELRRLALSGVVAWQGVAARRFARAGLAGLIAAPASEPAYWGALVGAARPRWSGSADPREEVLREAYALLLGAERSGGAGRRVAW